MVTLHDTAPDLYSLERRIAELQHELAEARCLGTNVASHDSVQEAQPDLNFASVGGGSVEFQQLVETSGAGIVVHKGWTPLYANQAYAELFGYDNPAEIIAAGTLEILFSPEAIERMLEFRKARLAGKYAPSEYEVEGVNKNGERIWVRNTVRVMDVGEEQLIHCTAINTTQQRTAEYALRESEVRFRTLFESVPISIREVNYSKVKERIDALPVSDRDSLATFLAGNAQVVGECLRHAVIENFNQACLDLHGATDIAAVAKQLQENISDPARKIFSDIMMCIFEGKTDLSFETTASRSDGTKRDVVSR
ncbi:MAG: hypothetical protein CL569_05630 [Alphaproteobacteria bacterium]|nr:hypothetical protein [Alphaproteobacteria bacterium]|tara:strand:- start:302 stop:1228 length:927 start_codon:yes stop_codon:yes gene_type:complete